jgi:hypothetical protein
MVVGAGDSDVLDAMSLFGGVIVGLVLCTRVLGKSLRLSLKGHLLSYYILVMMTMTNHQSLAFVVFEFAGKTKQILAER